MVKKSEKKLAKKLENLGLEETNGSARTITQGLLKHVAGIVKSCGATALFVYVDALEGPELDLESLLGAKVFCVTKEPAKEKKCRAGSLRCLRVPDVPLTRIGRVKIAVFLALSRGLIEQGDRIVFLSGLAATKTLDTIIVTEVGREYEIFAAGTDLIGTSSDILPEVIERIVDIASELGSEGREGRAVGAMFIIGDTDRVVPLTRQLVLNPFKGYPPDERSILDYSLEETVKELATLDGAFIISGDGVMETCGSYVRTASQEEYELPSGGDGLSQKSRNPVAWGKNRGLQIPSPVRARRTLLAPSLATVHAIDNGPSCDAQCSLMGVIRAGTHPLVPTDSITFHGRTRLAA